MKRNSWLFLILLIVGIVMIEHNSTPTAPMPTSATHQGSHLRIPAVLKQAPDQGEFWGLVRRGVDGQFVVTVYENRKVIVQFPAKQTIRTSADGTLYATDGVIRLDGDVYKALWMDIAQNQTSGWIELRPSAPPTTSH